MADRPQLTITPTGAPIHGNRSSLTCKYKCGDACFHDVPNTSSNETFSDVINSVISRRGVLKAAAVVGVAGAVGGALNVAGPAAQNEAEASWWRKTNINFDPIAPASTDFVEIPEGYEQDIVMRWGDKLFSRAPEFDPMKQTAAAQELQFGYNNDFLGFFELDAKTEIMMVNHEYTDEYIMFPDYDEDNPTREHAEIAWAAHGLSVVAVAKEEGTGRIKPIVDHKLNRRFTARSHFEIAGPLKGHEMLKTAADPSGSKVLGTLNNCSGGLTPWGTWLTGEENWNQYFANGQTGETMYGKSIKRYGIPTGESQRKWERFDDRFDLAKTPNEVNRFGYLVEIDPYDPTSTPQKRTLLGRFKHESGTAIRNHDGRAVVYSGDDERFDYVYKFVSRDKIAEGGAKANAELLNHGTLYVAKFIGNRRPELDGKGELGVWEKYDGFGEWIPLCNENESFVDGMSVEEVLLFTRMAGDKVGATKMDRPEDVEASPVTGKVYMALTNNTKRTSVDQVDYANPRTTNKHGHVIEMVEWNRQSDATFFLWNILLLCGDPADASSYYGGADKSTVSPISCPDNVCFDPAGNLWISTDGNKLGNHDGLYKVPVEGNNRTRGKVQQFLSVPTGAECCGPVVTDSRVNVAIQHPGETRDASFENRTSNWPDGGNSVPRPAVVSVWPTKK